MESKMAKCHILKLNKLQTTSVSMITMRETGKIAHFGGYLPSVKICLPKDVMILKLSKQPFLL